MAGGWRRSRRGLPHAFLEHQGIGPARSLVAFTRVHLAAHEGRDLNLTIDPRQLSQVDAAGHRAILPGRYLISVGGQQPDGKMPSLLLKITGRSEMPE